jgi:hypothetical protein
VPESETVKVELEALETTVMPPLTLTADCGLNRALKVTLAPGLSTRGTFSPLMLNPVPVAVACEIVTLDPPVLVSESVKVRLLPTWALPKARLAGLEVSWPAAVPVPESETVKVELEALDTTVMPPFALAADCGVNTALKGTLAPGLRTNGTLSPLMLNPAPVAVACEIVTLDPPVLVSESVKVRLLPTWALPKARLAGLEVS